MGGGRQAIAIKYADGSGSPEIIDSPIGRSYVNSWSRDGSILILDRGGTISGASAGSDLFVLPLTGDRKPQPFLTTKFDEWQASLSPDGKWLAYVSNQSGTYQVYIQPFPNGSGRWQVSTDEGYEPRWAPNGKTLYYYNPGRIMSVQIQAGSSLVIGKPQVLFSGYYKKTTDSGLNYDVSPDGQFFITTKSNDGDDNLRQINLVLNWFDDIQNRMVSNK